MGVYVKDVNLKDVRTFINIPKERIEIIITLPIEAIGLSTEQLKQKYIEEVKTPHGTLIDADEVGENVDWYCLEGSTDVIEAIPLEVIESVKTIIDEET